VELVAVPIRANLDPKVSSVKNQERCRFVVIVEIIAGTKDPRVWSRVRTNLGDRRSGSPFEQGTQ
jgi:hypothetical protein